MNWFTTSTWRTIGWSPKKPLHTLAGATDRVHWPLNAQKQPERYEGERLAKYVAERKKGAGVGTAVRG
jgi:hypothetical protein